MTDAPGNVVPFGKYRGQPVEVMLADRAYCEWAMAQPGIRERYPTFVTVVVNGGASPDAPTPEHNKMQLLFRDPAMRVATYRSIINDEMIARSEYRKHVSYEAIATAIRGVEVEFEVLGWDLILPLRWGEPIVTSRRDHDFPTLAIEALQDSRRQAAASIRAMKMRPVKIPNWKRALIVDHFEAESASLDDVKWIFAQSQIEVRTLAEIRAAMPAGVSAGSKIIMRDTGDFRRWLASVRVPHGDKVYLQDRAYPAIDELQANLDMLPATITSAKQLTDVVRDLGIGADWFDAEDVAAMLWDRYLEGWKG